jgi:hypothetical protein
MHSLRDWLAGGDPGTAIAGRHSVEIEKAVWL